MKIDAAPALFNPVLSSSTPPHCNVEPQPCQVANRLRGQGGALTSRQRLHRLLRPATVNPPVLRVRLQVALHVGVQSILQEIQSFTGSFAISGGHGPLRGRVGCISILHSRSSFIHGSQGLPVAGTNKPFAPATRRRRRTRHVVSVPGAGVWIRETRTTAPQPKPRYEVVAEQAGSACCAAARAKAS